MATAEATREVWMRSLLSLAGLLVIALPASVALGQAPPIVVIGPAPAGPPPDATPAVPPGYEIEGELGGVHFRGRVYAPSTPAQPTPAPILAPPVAPTPAPILAPPVAPAPIVAAPVAPARPAPQVIVVPPPSASAPPSPYLHPQVVERPRIALDQGFDFGGRLAMEVLGASLGFGAAIGLGYAVGSDGDRGSFMAASLLGTAGLVPTGVTIFGAAVAGGRGRFGGAMLGGLVGGALSGTVVLATDAQFREPWELVLAIAGPAILGSILGFEAQHALRTHRLEERAEHGEIELTGLSFSPLPHGEGAMLGATGTF